MSRSLLCAAFVLLMLIPACSSVPALPLVPADLDYLTRDDWGAQPPVLEMTAHEPTRITIHHTATRQDTVRTLAEKMIGLQEFSQSESALSDGRVKAAWADIPYHFYVDVHGVVAEGRELRFAGDSNTPYDPTGHVLVVFEGSFDFEELTDAQRHTLDRFIPHLAARWQIPADRLAAHRDFASTACPGDHLYAEIPRLRALIEEAQVGG